jgi:hypothetical protein
MEAWTLRRRRGTCHSQRDTDILQALAHRAGLIPTISRSLSRAAGTKVTSISLSEKLKSLTECLSKSTSESDESENPMERREAEQYSSSISNHLWLHLQKDLLRRPTPLLQALVSRDAKTVTQSDADEILEGTDSDDEFTG